MTDTTETKSVQMAKFSFAKEEHKILKFWDKHKIFYTSVKQNEHNTPFIFYDGPPFATGLPHHGHLLASTIKDIIPRYYTMLGRHVVRRFGWDCHGLPIEHEIDKNLGLSAQEALKKLGVAGYNDACRNIVLRYAKEWRQTINRIGRWVDFEHDYKTMDTNFMESVWWAFKQLWDKDLIYQGKKVLPFSTALGTVLSNFEAGSNYHSVQDPSVTVLFKLKDENTYLAIWTTTPWTLPANLAICVNADIEYVKLSDSEKNISFIISKECLATLKNQQALTVENSLKGSDLVGRVYEPLFAETKALASDNAFRVLADDYVTTSEGTGLVHTAPAFGEDDLRVAQNAGINELICPIDDEGKFTEDMPWLAGQYIKNADKTIIRALKSSGKLYNQTVIEHSYPHCPRSDTPLIYMATPAWYVNVTNIKQKLLDANKEINWIPDHIQFGRFGKWLEGAKDWCISRSRVWGTPLPIWINDTTNKRLCIGSISELEELSGTRVTDLHKEHIDHLEFKLADEPGTYRRIPEVLDCWFESGSMPYAQLHYPFENKDLFEKGFPAEFIAEGLDQTRGWFYTLIVLSAALFDKPAFKNVIVSGIVLAEDGRKMSKRLKNYTPPDKLMETYGADALRLYLINSGLVKSEEQRFADDGVKEMTRRTLLPWLNAFKFLETYAKIDDWDANKHQEKSDNILDQWIVSRYNTLLQIIDSNMKAYKLFNVVPALHDFLEDLTNCYIRLNRNRFWAPGLEQDKRAAYSTLYNILLQFTHCMAPFTPFLAETIYQQSQSLGAFSATQKKSIHLNSFPRADSTLIQHKLEAAVARMQQIILLGRQKRFEHKIKTKIPLPRLTIIHQDEILLNEIHKLSGYITRELNVKSIDYNTHEDKFIKLFAKPNSPILGKRFGKRFNQFRQEIENLNSDTLHIYEDTGEIMLLGEKISGDDILIFREAKPNSNAISNRFISIDLEFALDDTLLQEGMAREIVNRIQKTRKSLDLNVSDRIDITYNSDKQIKETILKHFEYIKTETLCVNINETTPTDILDFSYNIDSYKLNLSITKNN